MIGAIIGLLLGLASYFIGMPLIAPIFGAALGANAILKARRGGAWNKAQAIVGLAAIIIGVLVAVVSRISFR